MSLFLIILIALGLSIDSFAVSIANGLSIKNIQLKEKLKIALSLAVFQSFMPVLGWYAGIKVVDYIKSLDHWIAFGLLGFIGTKMIIESFSNKEITKNFKLTTSTLIIQSVATSIDALAIGLSFAILDIKILIPVIIIGIVTFLASILGLQIGKYLGLKFGKYVEIISGIVLISIGVKILIEHLFLS